SGSTAPGCPCLLLTFSVLIRADPRRSASAIREAPRAILSSRSKAGHGANASAQERADVPAHSPADADRQSPQRVSADLPPELAQVGFPGHLAEVRAVLHVQVDVAGLAAEQLEPVLV